MILILTVSCKNDYGKYNFRFPEVLDTLPTTDIRYSCQSMKSPINDILAIGDKDLYQIHITKEQPVRYAEPTRYRDTLLNKSGLKVIVDTIQNMSIDLGYYKVLPPPLTGEIRSLIKQTYLVQALNAFVVNLSENITHLDHQDARLIMIQEAKDELGIWRPIEFWRHHRSGTSYGTVELHPNQYVITKILRYDGEFETDIRLKLKNGRDIIYSEPFRGTININQFELPENLMQANISLDSIFLN
jgi:hypothetical protein